jgi:serine/threonine-protein kinase
VNDAVLRPEIGMFIGQTIGPFEIERELGSGAMGTVYKAKMTKEDGEVVPIALKVVSIGLLGNEGAMDRFDREANILKQLKHKHIVRLVGLGHYRKTPFIAMEFVDGEAMDRILARRGRLGWEEVFGYAKQLCKALQFAHDKGVIHRDLKPSNLMITRDGTLKLTDFGIAKDQDATALTGANSTIGTAAYMSPEQCKGDKTLGGKSDLYSLGIVMYELITGRKPYQAETTVDMFLKHVNEKPVRPSRIVQDLPIWVENLVLHLMEKEKETRPIDAATVERMMIEIEEKVATQQSAAEAVAKGRKGGRALNEDGAMDDTDRDAARTLREGKKRKKKKAKAAVGMPGWMKFAPPVVGLVAIAAIVYFLFLRPENPDKFFAEVSAAATPEAKIEKAGKFLERFGSQGGETVDKVRTILREGQGQNLEAILATRFRTQKMRTAQEQEDAEAYTNAWSALESEQKGDLPRAQEFWAKVKSRAAEARDKFGEGWGWLADRHVTDIKQADEFGKATLNDLRERQINESDWKADAAEPKSLATVAVRLGGLGGTPLVQVPGGPTPLPAMKDDAKAVKTWNDLAELTKDKPAERAWHLLAVRERKNYSDVKPETILPQRRAMLEKQLQTINAAWKAAKDDVNGQVARRDCRNRVRDLVELYTDESDATIQGIVKAAKALLTAMGKS